MILIAEIGEVGVGVDIFREFFRPGSTPNHNQALRIFEREGPKQHRIDHAEDGAVGANPESEGEDGNEGEAGRLDKLAEGVAKVIHRIADL